MELPKILTAQLQEQANPLRLAENRFKAASFTGDIDVKEKEIFIGLTHKPFEASDLQARLSNNRPIVRV